MRCVGLKWYGGMKQVMSKDGVVNFRGQTAHDIDLTTKW